MWIPDSSVYWTPKFSLHRRVIADFNMASAAKLRILPFGYAGICVSVCSYSSVLMDLYIFTEYLLNTPPLLFEFSGVL